MARLSAEAARGAVGALPGWTLTAEGAAMEKVFQFRTFRQAMAFVNRVAELATEARHHPDIHISYNRVTLTLTTHDEEGLTEKDIALARRIEEVGEGASDG